MATGPASLPAGKLPNELLAQLLARVAHRDPRVLIGPAVGRDAAVIDTGAPKLLVAKTDPVTFATDLIGWYAVHVNANDIACLGAWPAWFLASVLLPENCPADLPGEILSQLSQACDALGIELIGGHTEITYRLDRPIVVGAMLGEVERDRLITGERARPGDAVILTKGIAIEGTAVLAREAGPVLLARGASEQTVARAADYLTDPGISIVLDAAAACDAVPVHAMHDPTEGGLATALYELAAACSCGVSVDADSINIFPETQAICAAAGLDPFGLLASGALLLVVPDKNAGAATAALWEAGVSARRIGSLQTPADGVIMAVNGESRPVPRFDRDEAARFLSGLPD